MIIFDNIEYSQAIFNNRNEVLIATNFSKTHVLKIEIVKNNRKNNSLVEEYKILKNLNFKNSQTCPEVYTCSDISKDDLLNSKILDGNNLDTFNRITKEKLSFNCFSMEYLNHSDDYSLADIVLSVLEQKKLGVYQADIKPDNIRYNKHTGICYLIDYDQAINLESKHIDSDNLTFFKYCSMYDKHKYGFGNWLRHFVNYDHEDLTRYFEDNSFNIAETSIFKIQNTTNAANGIYHTIKNKDIYCDGVRSVDVRSKLLDNIIFTKGEKVLDIGCNAGLLSMYLEKRGCCVTGMDNDPHIILGSKIVNNINGTKIDYQHCDLDEIDQLSNFDTIMLFSVFHHTRDPILNAKKISSACKRIIIESRLEENGSQPIGEDNSWIPVTRWKFDNVKDMELFFEKIFEGFKIEKNHGQCDKNRFIFELVRK